MSDQKNVASFTQFEIIKFPKLQEKPIYKFYVKNAYPKELVDRYWGSINSISS